MKKSNMKETMIDQNVNLVDDNSATSSIDDADVKETVGGKKDGGKKVGCQKATALKAIALTLYILAFAIMIGMTLMLAIKSYVLMPYYTFWPFLGTIFIFIFALVFLVVSLCVTRKKSKKTIRNQTVCLVITFFCLTGGFGILLNVAFPDLISFATQGTLHTEAMYNTGDKQVEINAGLVRQFIRYNILNGNIDPQYSYKDMAKNTKNNKVIVGYVDEDIQFAYDEYMSKESNEINSAVTGLNGYKKELYNFIYDSYILMDYDYAFASVVHSRRALGLALTDKVFPLYNKLCKEGMKNPRVKYLFDNNFRSLDQDGYLALDDPLLLFAQMEGRMTIPTVVRLILDNKYKYTEPIFNEDGGIVGYDGYLYELYAPEIRDDFVNKENGVFVDGKAVNSQGFIIMENGWVKKPMNWCVLDMDGNVMDVASIDIAGKLGSIGGIITGVLAMPTFTEAISELLNNKLGEIISVAANGAKLSLQMFSDDNGNLAISVVPANVEYGVLGYMQMSWLVSNNLLVGVINLISIRNILLLFGAIGLVLILGASLLREYGKKELLEAKENANGDNEEK